MAIRKAQKLIPVNGRRMRVTRLDSCGRIVYGDNAVVTSAGFASASLSANTSSTDAVEVKNANGDMLLAVAEVQSFSSYGVEIEFVEVDPELFSLITGNRVIYDAFGNPNGVVVNSKVLPTNVGFALEVWAGAPASGTCAVGASGSYGYALLPFVTGGVLGDHEFTQGAISFTLTGMSTKDGNAWGVGPYKVALNATSQPAALPVPLDAYDHYQLITTGVNPPDATTGSRPQLDPTVPALTAISAPTNTGRVYTFTATAAVAAGVGTWWDFGDGTFEYVTSAGSSVVHTYAAAGTYNVQASTNGTWVNRSVTVS